MSLPTYPQYKKAGLPWLSEVPVGWEVKRAKHVFKIINERSKTGEEEKLTVSSKNGVVPRRGENVTMFMAASYVGHKLCWPGDLVVNSLWAWANGLGFSNHHGLVSTAYSVYRPLPDFAEAAPYLHYLLRSSAFQWELQVGSKGIWTSRLQLTDDTFLRMPILLPPLAEQRQIVAFLDHHTRQINRLVRAKRRLIGLLQEQKQALIHRAVTQGLDAQAPMKASGVAWLGAVPGHWEVKRLKLVLQNIVQQTTQKQEGDTYIALENIESWSGRLTFAEEETPFESQVKRFACGDVLFGKLRPYLAKVVLAEYNGVCVGELLVLRVVPNAALLPAFVALKLRSKPMIDLINSSTFGAKMPRADWEFIGNIAFSFPPLEEQHAIVAHIESETRLLDATISRAQREVELLQEYRTRLVADVVTGRADVRRVVVPVGVAAEEAEGLDEAEEAEVTELAADAD